MLNLSEINTITKPIVHCITNYVTVNACANVILSAGGSPIMTDEVDEMLDIVKIADSLLINIGTLNQQTIAAMFCAGGEANRLSKPIILDPVGVFASQLRTKTINDLLQQVDFAVIKGNLSEIKFLANKTISGKGVDAGVDDVISKENLPNIINMAKSLAINTKSIIVITGAIDVITDGKRVAIINNGHQFMTKITGTGCMLGAMIASLVGANCDKIYEAIIYSVAKFNIAGELAFAKMTAESRNTASYQTLLIDYINEVDNCTFQEKNKIEFI